MKFIVLIVVMGLRRMDAGWSPLLAGEERHQRWLQRCDAASSLWCGGWLCCCLQCCCLGHVPLSGFWGQLLVLGLGVLLLWLLGSHSGFRHVDELLVRDAWPGRVCCLAWTIFR